MKIVGIYLSLLLVLVIWVILWPALFIWGLNTLFTLDIEFNFWAWLAVAVITALFTASKSASSAKQ